MTPCALLNIPMMNIFPMTIEEMNEKYKANPIVRNMLTMNLKGKCKDCSKKYQCGGCRARALIQKGDYLEEDPHCWK
ncbi:MAG: SPASM domain-containing protein [Nanoarchaeota archaeon]|nr:SPASM domain-containing protein [Nanoarchaeota archaeon]